MTPDLESRRKSDNKPFDGEIITSSADSSMETLLKVMRYFIEIVIDPSDRLLVYDDWHEHDGFITDSKVIALEDLKGKVKNSESLKVSVHGDYEVRTAVYPDNYKWLMRWCIDTEDDAYCDFEFCCSKEANQDGLELMYSINPEGLNREKAKNYFERTYGG